MSSKFFGLEYPIFCLKDIPKDFTINGDRLLIRQQGNMVLVDDRSINKKAYIDRLLEIEKSDVKRAKFDYTISNLSELIHSKARWCISNSGKVFDLSIKQQFNIRCSKVRKQLEDYIWVNEVSYPFKVASQFIEEDLVGLYATIVNIDNTWCLYSFNHFRTERKRIWL